MNILLIGKGGREHAIAFALAKSLLVKNIYVAPGNAGTALTDKCHNIDIDILDFTKLISFVKENKIDFAFVGPELPLCAGIVDIFEEHNIPCLGPNKNCAQLEASKSFTKDFLQKYNIPIARSKTFIDVTSAKEYIAKQNLPIVIKADGLAAGKGVVIANTYGEAIATIDDFLSKHTLGDAGNKVVIEEFLSGVEASFIVLCDGKNIIPLASSQDHKRRDDGDLGPNTGGMGAFSPAPIVDEALHQQVMQKIIWPTINGLKNEGYIYKGFLYAGLMIDDNHQAKVLEFNCRLGDPETQVLLPRIKSDFALLCQHAITESLHEYELQWLDKSALTVVLAAKGYPENPKRGDVINLPVSLNPDEFIFHAGTKMLDEKVMSDGGRVLCVTALGDTLLDAKNRAYQLIDKISFDGMFYRKDIGAK